MSYSDVWILIAYLLLQALYFQFGIKLNNVIDTQVCILWFPKTDYSVELCRRGFVVCSDQLLSGSEFLFLFFCQLDHFKNSSQDSEPKN